MSRRSRGEPDYASYDSYLRDQGLCPEHMICLKRDGTCHHCEAEKDEPEEAPE